MSQINSNRFEPLSVVENIYKEIKFNPKEKLSTEIDLSLKELERQYFSEQRELQLQRERVRLLNAPFSDN